MLLFTLVISAYRFLLVFWWDSLLLNRRCLTHLQNKWYIAHHEWFDPFFPSCCFFHRGCSSRGTNFAPLSFCCFSTNSRLPTWSSAKLELRFLSGGLNSFLKKPPGLGEPARFNESFSFAPMLSFVSSSSAQWGHKEWVRWQHEDSFVTAINFQRAASPCLDSVAYLLQIRLNSLTYR